MYGLYEDPDADTGAHAGDPVDNDVDTGYVGSHR